MQWPVRRKPDTKQDRSLFSFGHGEKFLVPDHMVLITQRLFKVISLQLIIGLLVPAPLYAASKVAQGNQQQLRDVQTHIKSLQQELTDKEATKSKTADALRDIERLISSIQYKILQLKQQQSEINNESARLQRSSEQLRNEMLAKQIQLGKLLYFQNLISKSDYLSLFLKQSNPDEITRKLYYYRYLAQSRSAHIDELRHLQGQLASLIQNQASQRDKFKQSQQEYFAQMQLLTAEKAKHADLLATLSRETSQQHTTLSRLKQDEQHLTNLIERLSRQLLQKKPVVPEKHSEKHSGTTILHNNQLPSATARNSSFAAMKGKLRLPVRGELVNRFGSLRDHGGVKWNGLFIRAADGNEVKAIAGGQVVFAEWIRGFGNFIILDHGNDYMSLYGHNDALTKRVGDEVRSGDTIAVVGNSGGNNQSGLYFELRHKGKPFDPLTWISIK